MDVGNAVTGQIKSETIDLLFCKWRQHYSVFPTKWIKGMACSLKKKEDFMLWTQKHIDEVFFRQIAVQEPFRDNIAIRMRGIWRWILDAGIFKGTWKQCRWKLCKWNSMKLTWYRAFDATQPPPSSRTRKVKFIIGERLKSQKDLWWWWSNKKNSYINKHLFHFVGPGCRDQIQPFSLTALVTTAQKL